MYPLHLVTRVHILSFANLKAHVKTLGVFWSYLTAECGKWRTDGQAEIGSKRGSKSGHFSLRQSSVKRDAGTPKHG